MLKGFTGWTKTNQYSRLHRVDQGQSDRVRCRMALVHLFRQRVDQATSLFLLGWTKAISIKVALGPSCFELVGTGWTKAVLALVHPVKNV